MYTIKIRTRYQRYVGEYVLHCHIFDHEDQGMMQKVRIELPDGVGGMTRSHHWRPIRGDRPDREFRGARKEQLSAFSTMEGGDNG